MTKEEMEKFVQDNMTSVFQFCCFLTGNRLDGEELCQDTFLKAVELRHRLKSGDKENDRKKTKNYIIGIAVRIWKNKKHKIKRRQEIVPISQWDDSANRVADSVLTENIILQNEVNKMIQDCICHLPTKQRIVMNMHYGAQMNVNEIAEILHISKDTVKSRIRLAKEKIRAELEVNGYER